MGVPPVIIHFSGIFPYKPASHFGVPPFLEKKHIVFISMIRIPGNPMNAAQGHCALMNCFIRIGHAIVQTILNLLNHQ